MRSVLGETKVHGVCTQRRENQFNPSHSEMHTVFFLLFYVTPDFFNAPGLT